MFKMEMECKVWIRFKLKEIQSREEQIKGNLNTFRIWDRIRQLLWSQKKKKRLMTRKKGRGARLRD